MELTQNNLQARIIQDELISLYLDRFLFNMLKGSHVLPNPNYDQDHE